jgi:5S rRNA maturation endonuclease (ribonuclease M5)
VSKTLSGGTLRDTRGHGDDWRTRFAQLDALPPSSDDISKQQRGRDFERVLHYMFDEAGMAPRKGFRPQGEEIDGSFLFHGRPMLFEAKWTNDPIPASTLYQFRGKLDGKLIGTIGLFISMGGYSKDAVDALIAGKSLNLILFDGDDMRALANSQTFGIEAAINLKLRAAAEEGTPLMPLHGLVAPSPSMIQSPVLIVEGSYDAQILHALIERAENTRSPTVLPAGGRLNLPLVALALLNQRSVGTKLGILADGDGKAAKVRKRIENTLADAGLPPNVDIEILVVDPNLESALGLVNESSPTRPSVHTLDDVLRDLDLSKLAANNDDLTLLLRLLGLLN